MAYERQFQINNPGLPRRTDDASMQESGQGRGSPVPPGRTLSGKVMAPVMVPPMVDAMPGLGANSRPPGCALSSDCGSRMLGMDRRSNGNGMGQGKAWRF